MTNGALSGSWMAARYGLDPVAIEVRRRAGELFATRAPGSDEWMYPSWQFDQHGELTPDARRVLDAAREAGLTQSQLAELLRRRVGLAGRRTMQDLLLAGDPGVVLSAIRTRSAQSF